jgi:membrane associated rhomboid family serine protease
MRSYYDYDRPEVSQPSFRLGWTPTVKGLILANAAAYLVFLMLVGQFGRSKAMEWVGFYGPNFLHGYFWQPVTYMFVHAGLWHLVINMLGLFFFAGDVQRRLGRLSFLVLYFLCGLGGAMLSLIQPGSVVIGASGGVLGVVIAFAMLFPDARIFLFPIFIPIRARYIAVIYGFITIAGLLGGMGGGVAHWAHLGGMLVAFLYLLARPFGTRLLDLWGAVRPGHGPGQSRDADRPARRDRRSPAEQAELDRILEKVHRDGITSLSNQERDFLSVCSRKYRDRD